ncbi:glycosyltransferase family 4 protein [Rheinheimera sp.]|uniref:glycosyltransferase family 4 protein n=1 Tax=Rheinheimera sp. TaxID=1869214 RepID=UPI002FDD8CED
MQNELAGLRICLIGPIPPPAGGMANQTRQLKLLLEQEGAIVSMVAVNAPYQPSFIGKIPGLRALFRLLPYLLHLYRAIGQTDVCHLMANSGWSWHLFAAPAIWIAHWRKKPMVMNYRGGHAKQFFEGAWSVVGPSVRRCSAVVVPSAYLRRVFAEFATDAVVIPNVLEQKRFYPAADLNAKLTVIPAKPHLIVTRNLEAIYDIATAVRAFALLKTSFPQATLSVAGSGPEEHALRALCQELKISDSVHFLGRLHADQMAELYRSADLMLNTSLVDNSPNSVIEALACGIPVLTSNVGGIPDLVSDGVDAVLLPPGDAALFSQHAVEILTNNRLRQQLIENGLAKTARFAWSSVSQALFHTYQTAISSRNQAGSQ